MTAIHDAFGPPGKHIDPSIPVRRWDLGLSYAALGFALLFVPIAWSTLGTSTFRALSLDPAFYSRIDNPRWLHDWAWLATASTLGLAAGIGMGWLGLIPRANQWVVDGPRLLQGRAALREARKRSGSLRDQMADRFGMWLHPKLFLAKKILSRHLLIYGSVGSGKTQILLALLKQIFAHKDAKLFLYDVKGDFTSKFPQDQAQICSPFDSRSRVWWVARDVRTSTQAAAFADSLIPEDSGSGKFWTQAAQQILLGVVRSLQNEKPEQWTWSDLAQRVSMTASEMAPILDKNYRKAYGLISNTEGQTAFNVIATLNGYTRVIDDLARAWPTYDTELNGQGTKDPVEGTPLAYVPRPANDAKGRKAAMKARRDWHADFQARHHVFSLTDWAADDYTGPHKIIVQAGPDSSLTAAYISAMVNVAVPAIISPQLPDNEGGRFLGFVFDEMSSIGKINFAPLVDKGRSKGVVVVAGVQDLAQLREIYGDNPTKALQGMVGTQIICQIAMGETRDELSKLIGNHNVARIDHAPDARLSNDGKQVVYPSQLTDMLGFRKQPKKKPGDPGFAIRAIVQQGGDLLLLDFPGQPMPDKRRGQVPAAWTQRAAGFEPERPEEEVHAALAGKAMGEALDADSVRSLMFG